MKKNIIESINVSGELLAFELGKKTHKLIFGSNEIEYSVKEYCLQDVKKDFLKLTNLKNCDDHKISGLGYVSQSVFEPYCSIIYNVLNDAGIKNLFPSKEYHFTLLYDKVNPVIDYSEMPRDMYLRAKAVDVCILGKDTDNQALAIIFESEDLDERFNELQEMGFKYDFDKYIPHVTIKYNPEDGDFDLVKANMQLIIDSLHNGVVFCGYEVWRKAK